MGIKTVITTVSWARSVGLLKEAGTVQLGHFPGAFCLHKVQKAV